MYAADFTFYHCFRQRELLEEINFYFSRKDKFYGFELEVLVLPNGWAARASKKYPASTSSFEIFQPSNNFYMHTISETERETGRRDVGFTCNLIQKCWPCWLRSLKNYLLKNWVQSIQFGNHYVILYRSPMNPSIERSLRTVCLLKIISVGFPLYRIFPCRMDVVVDSLWRFI